MSSPPNRSLRSIRLFASVKADALARIEARCDWRTYQVGETIVSLDDPTLDVYFLVDGLARISIYAVNGQQVQFRDKEPGAWFGEFSALDGKKRSATVEALKPCLVAKMSSKIFLETLEHEPAVALALLRHLVGVARDLTARVFEFSVFGVNSRLHAELLRLGELAGQAGKTVMISPAPTHADIANQISTHREAVSRELSRLKREGIIKKHNHGLEICDMNRLRRLVEEATGE